MKYLDGSLTYVGKWVYASAWYNLDPRDWGFEFDLYWGQFTVYFLGLGIEVLW